LYEYRFEALVNYIESTTFKRRNRGTLIVDGADESKKVEGTSLQEDERRRSFGARPKHAHLHPF
jgi:hypothetical protein